MNSVVIKLDQDAELQELAHYSLDPHKALIAYYMQNEKNSFNTWEYPDEVQDIKPRPMGLGYYYVKGEDVIYSRIEGD